MSENICKDKCNYYGSCPQVGRPQECQIWWDIQRLAAVRELVRDYRDLQYQAGRIDYNAGMLLESLRLVWPEAVEE